MEYIPAKTIVTHTKSTEWFGAMYNMNIYRGCNHGCIYCDSRSDCYRNPDFDTVKVKENALEIIRNDLRRKVKRGVVSSGAMSDPYNPLERTALLTRNALELINAYGFGINLTTKSPLITRDCDTLCDIAKHSPVIAGLTITTLYDDLCLKLEPHVAPSSERFAAIKALAENGIFCGILMMPILPFVNDTEENIIGIVQAAAHSGAKFVYPSFGVSMRDGQREYFLEKLDAIFPGHKQKYLQNYGMRYTCSSPRAKKLWQIFTEECNRYGLLYNMRDIIRVNQAPYQITQLSLDL